MLKVSPTTCPNSPLLYQSKYSKHFLRMEFYFFVFFRGESTTNVTELLLLFVHPPSCNVDIFKSHLKVSIIFFSLSNKKKQTV